MSVSHWACTLDANIGIAYLVTEDFSANAHRLFLARWQDYNAHLWALRSISIMTEFPKDMSLCLFHQAIAKYIVADLARLV